MHEKVDQKAREKVKIHAKKNLLTPFKIYFQDRDLIKERIAASK